VIDPDFVFLGAALFVIGAAIYVRDTWRGRTAPNRVTWIIWGLEPLLTFATERQAHVGLASVMTLVLGLIPVIVLVASLHDSASVWRIGRFDIVCGVISAVGFGVWIVSDRPTVGLVSFVAADAVAAVPTLRKAATHPRSESPWNYLAGAIFSGITLLTLTTYTTAGGLFPTSVLVMNTTIWLLVMTRVGPRWRTRGSTVALGAR
jgi:hypothetical protein